VAFVSRSAAPQRYGRHAALVAAAAAATAAAQVNSNDALNDHCISRTLLYLLLLRRKVFAHIRSKETLLPTHTSQAVCTHFPAATVAASGTAAAATLRSNCSAYTTPEWAPIWPAGKREHCVCTLLAHGCMLRGQRHASGPQRPATDTPPPCWPVPGHIMHTHK
jgi:hypothetical protein